jgi:hypothetical protein
VVLDENDKENIYRTLKWWEPLEDAHRRRKAQEEIFRMFQERDLKPWDDWKVNQEGSDKWNGLVP